MNDICLCIDLDGFRLEDDFIVREMGWCDKSTIIRTTINGRPLAKKSKELSFMFGTWLLG